MSPEARPVRPAVFVVKATVSPRLESAFNDWHETERARQAARVRDASGCAATRPSPSMARDAGAEPWQYMVCYEFDSEETLRAFLASDTLREMTRDYDRRLGGAGGRVRLAYRQVCP